MTQIENTVREQNIITINFRLRITSEVRLTALRNNITGDFQGARGANFLT